MKQLTGLQPERPISKLRMAWDRLPMAARRPILRAMSNERLRLTVLDKLHIRSRSGFVSVSDGGPYAVTAVMEHLATDGPVGDYYEFGLYRGYTFWAAQDAANRVGLRTMRFFGFDSFEGLPTVEGADGDAAIFIPGDYSCTKTEVANHLTEHGFDWSRGHLIEGFFDESLNDALRSDLSMAPAAAVMIDCDLYQSTVPVLSFIEPLLQQGTVLVFDDWHCFGGGDDRGEPRAFAEFLARHPRWRAEVLTDYPTYGRVFMIHETVPESNSPAD